MKLGDMKSPFSSDEGTLKFTGILGAAHAACMVLNPQGLQDKLMTNPRDSRSMDAMTRMGGAMAGAAAITALALANKDDMGAARRMALTATGATMLGVAAVQGVETHEKRLHKRLGWASTAVHGGLGAMCLYRGMKEGFGK